MTTISMSAPAVAQPTVRATNPTIGDEAPSITTASSQFLARLTGAMFVTTFVTSIVPVVSLYVPALSDPAFVLGGGFDTSVSWGAIFELLLILSNIATALTLYPVLRRRFAVLPLAYVTARLTECGLIALGIVALLAMNTLRANAGEADPATLTLVGKALIAVHDWTFRLGPGVVVGVGNGLILGWMMWRSRLVPRAMSILGLIGGPLIVASGVAVVLGVIEAGSIPQGIATIPEFLWELSLGVWLLVRGFNPTALTAIDARQA